MVDMQKILYVITKSNWGGAQKYVYELATSLPKDKFEAAVVLGGNGILAAKLQEAGIRVINLKNLEKEINIFKELSVLFDLIKIFRQEKPDVIHLNSSKIGGLGALAGRIAGVPKIIFTAHGFAHNEDHSAPVRLALFLLSYLTILLSHKTIVINQRELEEMQKLPFIKNKLQLIYIGLRQKEITKIGKETGSAIAIGTISELTKNKGLEYAIRAVSRLKNKNINFTIIGEGDERKELEKLIGNLNLTENVQLLGCK